MYVKADKGNKLVILSKEDYNSRVIDLINECNYKKLTRSPLPSMVRQSDKLGQKIGCVFAPRHTRQLLVSSPTVALLYCLPKIHKEGNKMRPIVSSINTPTYLVAKWLVNEMRRLTPIKSRSVKNSFDLGIN